MATVCVCACCETSKRKMVDKVASVCSDEARDAEPAGWPHRASPLGKSRKDTLVGDEANINAPEDKGKDFAEQNPSRAQSQ